MSLDIPTPVFPTNAADWEHFYISLFALVLGVLGIAAFIWWAYL